MYYRSCGDRRQKFSWVFHLIYFFNQLYKVISLKYWFKLSKVLTKSVIRVHSYLVLSSKGFSLIILSGTLLLIHLGIPTNRRLPSLQVHREVDMFWEITRFNSAWLVSALRTHGVSWSAHLCPWPVANQHSSMVTWTVHQFSGNRSKKEHVHGGGPLASCWHSPHSRLFLFGSIPLKTQGAAVQQVSDSHTT